MPRSLSLKVVVGNLDVGFESQLFTTVSLLATLSFPPVSLSTAFQSNIYHSLIYYLIVRAASFSAPSCVLRLETMPPAALNTLLSHYNNILKSQSF